MLILTRKTNEVVVVEVDGLDHPIEIMIVSISPGRVKVGLKAEPNKVRFFRNEVYTEVLQQRLEHPELHKGSGHASEPIGR